MLDSWGSMSEAAIQSPSLRKTSVRCLPRLPTGLLKTLKYWLTPLK